MFAFPTDVSRSLIIPCVATFLVDLVLEFVVFFNVQGALASIETVKDCRVTAVTLCISMFTRPFPLSTTPSNFEKHQSF